MIKSKILISMMIIALLSAVVTGATVSVFTDSAENGKNTFATGTVKVSAENQAYEEGVNLSNMVPGDVVSGSFEVKNSGSLELLYDVTPVTSGDLFTKFNNNSSPAFVTITENDTSRLEPGKSVIVKYNVTLPQEADNQYSGTEGKLSFKVNAVQTKNHVYENYLGK